MKTGALRLAVGVGLSAVLPLAAQDLNAGSRVLSRATAEETSGGGGGAAGEDSTEALAKAAQNPVAKLISVPFQNNFNFGVGPEDVTPYVLNVQVQAFYNVEHPDNGANWQLRVQLQLLFPK